MKNYFQCGRYRLPLQESARPLVMGVLNVTPDSFSDGGQYHAFESALSHAEQMIADGVDIIDIGGETTRPGAKVLLLEVELQRVMPLVYALRDCGKPISIDTYKPEVMRQALAAGADMINDINGFRAEGAVDAIKDSDCGLCVMHMQNQPQNMQDYPKYTNPVDEVICFLQERVAVLQAAGISRSRICIDPGFGFGKTLPHNVALLKSIAAIQEVLDLPLLAGLSRKSMLGAITGQPVEKRLAGSLAAALAAVANGAKIVRVHDVAETIDALAVWQVATR
ncbi:MAG: dihydropteroate synthase [Glaciimonas sp.]|nr:dihydropteroate synthase [Glaciimonas sp.]